MSYVIFIFLLCLTSTLHACNSRILYSTDDQSTDHEAFHYFTDVEKAKYQRYETISNPLNPKPATTSMVSQIEAKNNGNWVTKSVYYPQPELQKHSTETSHKGQKGKPIRSILGVEQGTEEAVETKQSGSTTVDDIVMMDYAQPHRKPPIHNEKP